MALRWRRLTSNFFVWKRGRQPVHWLHGFQLQPMWWCTLQAIFRGAQNLKTSIFSFSR